jgi:hypothetical protein
MLSRPEGNHHFSGIDPVPPWCGRRRLPTEATLSGGGVAKVGGGAQDGDTTANDHNDVVAVGAPQTSTMCWR